MKKTLQDLVTHEVGPGTEVTTEALAEFFEEHGVSSGSASLLCDIDIAVLNILEGNLVIFYDGWDKALTFETMGLEKRDKLPSQLTKALYKAPGTAQ